VSFDHIFALTYEADYTHYAFTPGWKPSGFNATDELLSLSSVSDVNFGIPGTGGALFGFM
jgi:amino acid transporter